VAYGCPPGRFHNFNPRGILCACRNDRREGGGKEIVRKGGKGEGKGGCSAGRSLIWCVPGGRLQGKKKGGEEHPFSHRLCGMACTEREKNGENTEPLVFRHVSLVQSSPTRRRKVMPEGKKREGGLCVRSDFWRRTPVKQEKERGAVSFPLSPLHQRKKRREKKF